jgi:hypothetical protein
MSLTTALRSTAAAAFALAGFSFAAYPALRPYSDETTLEGAHAMASTAWVAAHSLGMVGFITLTLGVWATSRLAGVRTRRAADVAVTLTWLGTSLVLPYYGAETFGLQVIAEHADATGDAGLLELAETFRYGAVPLAFFATGLLALAAAGVALVLAVRRSTTLVRLGGTTAGLALAAYLPQFFLAPGLRIGHGVLLGIGLLLLAAGLRLPTPTPAAEPPLLHARPAPDALPSRP